MRTARPRDIGSLACLWRLGCHQGRLGTAPRHLCRPPAAALPEYVPLMGTCGACTAKTARVCLFAHAYDYHVHAHMRDM